MNTLVIFYSYSGHTKAIATDIAAKESADILEVKEAKRRGKFRAYTAGIFASIKGTTWPIQPLDTDLAQYDRLILLSPVWASNPPPPFNALLQILPEGKTISVKMISGSGKSECKERLEAAIQSRGSVLESLEDIKAKDYGK